MNTNESDVVLIGAGIMSATLGVLLKELAPEKSITIFEKLASPALESSYEWNNAGTGHAALCELNYTPQQDDGSVAISRAVAVNEKFQQSLQMWSYLVKNGCIDSPQDFIRRLPHMSFV
ncbi:MAG: malate:quinone oxidoreductase, partial [Kingella sp. (in: b-proteobacteria)]